jgi:hypothetical protein
MKRPRTDALPAALPYPRDASTTAIVAWLASAFSDTPGDSETWRWWIALLDAAGTDPERVALACDVAEMRQVTNAALLDAIADVRARYGRST